MAQNNSALHMAAPFIAVGATMALRKMMNGGYRQLTGKTPPDPNSSSTPVMTAILWAVATAAAGALLEVAIYRLTATPDDSSVN